jgi:hypothetical protein
VCVRDCCVLCLCVCVLCVFSMCVCVLCLFCVCMCVFVYEKKDVVNISTIYRNTSYMRMYLA